MAIRLKTTPRPEPRAKRRVHWSRTAKEIGAAAALAALPILLKSIEQALAKPVAKPLRKHR